MDDKVAKNCARVAVKCIFPPLRHIGLDSTFISHSVSPKRLFPASAEAEASAEAKTEASAEAYASVQSLSLGIEPKLRYSTEA